MKGMCETLPKPAHHPCRTPLRGPGVGSARASRNTTKSLFIEDKGSVAWMLLSQLKRRCLNSRRRGVYVSHPTSRSIMRISLSPGLFAGDRPHHRHASIGAKRAHARRIRNGGLAWRLRSISKQYATRSLLIVWVASLACLAVPVSFAEPASSNAKILLNHPGGATWSECQTEWKLRFCAPSEAFPNDEEPPHHRVKARDVLRAMADAILGDGFQLLNIGRHNGPSFLERALDSGPVQYFVLSDSQGVRLRLRTKSDGWSLSLRDSPNEYDEESLAVKVGLDIRW